MAEFESPHALLKQSQPKSAFRLLVEEVREADEGEMGRVREKGAVG